MSEYNDRYKPIRQGFWWKVKIGDGQQTVGKCYTETEAQRLSAALLTAFYDGQYVALIGKSELLDLEINKNN